MRLHNSRPRKGDMHGGTYEPDRNTSLYLGLIGATLQDVASICNYPDVERQRDYEEIRNRTAGEGICFLTKTLPSFAKAIDIALATDTRLAVKGFKKSFNSVLPRIFSALTSLVFDSDGWERSDACPQALRSLRQICYLYYKLQLPLDEEQADEVIAKFKNTDKSLEFNPSDLSFREERMLRQARNLISRVLANVDPKAAQIFAPRHGPGAVATGEKGAEKVIFKRWYRRLAAYFPYEEYFFYNQTHLCDDLEGFMAMEELEAGTAKVVLVPKDSRGPRLISCEPLEYQWIQQGLMRVLVKTIQSHPLTAGYVNFTHQDVNRTLALRASKDGSMATLDMKDASDRVSWRLVQALFPQNWVDALSACRSTATKLPNGEVVTLNKFAPMGSAVCFPVEALVFWALSVAAVMYDIDRVSLVSSPRGSHDDDMNPLYRFMSASTMTRWRKLASQSIYVYGDDIICRIEDQDTIRRFLPGFGLMFNDEKCCVGRSFRESCGCDAYKGVDVTPLKQRATWCHRLPGTTYVSWVALHNALNLRGYFHACDFLAEEIQRQRRTPYSESSEVGLVSLVDCRKTAIQENARLKIPRRYNENLQRYEYYSWVVRARVKHASTPGWAEMQRIASYKGIITPEPGDNSYSRHWFGEEYSPSSMSPAPGPAVLSDSSFIAEDLSNIAALVTAYRYTLPRQVVLRRGWGCLNNSRS